MHKYIHACISISEINKSHKENSIHIRHEVINDMLSHTFWNIYQHDNKQNKGKESKVTNKLNENDFFCISIYYILQYNKIYSILY